MDIGSKIGLKRGKARVPAFASGQRMNRIFSLDGVSKVFVTEDGREVRALDDVSLAGATGEFLCLLGPTGCGKTTLLRLLAGLEVPSRGEVRVQGLPPDKTFRSIGYVFQQGALFPWRTALGNVLFGLEARKWPKAEARKRARECLSLVKLDGVENAWPHELSGGMQQRVAIARAVALEPSLLLLDEPFGALDEKTRRDLQEELLRLWEESGVTLVFVTHNVEEAVSLGQRVVVLGMNPGRIEEEFRVEIPYPRDPLSPAFVETMIEIRRSINDIVT